MPEKSGIDAVPWLGSWAKATDEKSVAATVVRSGYSVAWSGWAGDVAVAPHKMSITLPVATKADGSPITGPVVAELMALHFGRIDVALAVDADDVEVVELAKV